MDTINGLILCWAIGTHRILGCKMDAIEHSEHKLRKEVCGDSGVYHVTSGDRFGTIVLLIQCIDQMEENRIKEKIGLEYDGWPVYYSSPIWRPGDLVPFYKNKLNALIYHKDFQYPTSEIRQQWNNLMQKVESAELQYWKSLTGVDKAKMVKGFVLQLRSDSKQAANCGDKFLNSPPPPPSLGP